MIRFIGLSILLFIISGAQCWLWPKGVVHYSVDPKDYDPHSQDVIMSALIRIEREICVKFFKLPLNYTRNPANKIDKFVLISNPNKIKDCPPLEFNLTGSVITFPIGYKCLNEKDISVMIVDLLKATFKNNQDQQFNSNDLLRDFTNQDNNDDYLIPSTDRNLINTYYFNECGALYQRLAPLPKRRSGADDEQPISPLTFDYYSKFPWPLGVVMYTVVPELRGTEDHTLLKQAMTTIELSSCVVFQFVDLSGPAVLDPKNVLVFDVNGADTVGFGFVEGQQVIKLSDMIHGARGHTAHTLNMLFRILGIPMTSNRYDRDNYISINWKRVIKGKEHLLEKVPEEAFVHYIPYEFESVTHAPANFMCDTCDLGASTVEPIQDLLWQRTLVMGHRTVLSFSDTEMLKLVYARECARRNGVGDLPLREGGNNTKPVYRPADVDDSKIIGLPPNNGDPILLARENPNLGVVLAPDPVKQINDNKLFNRY